MERAPLVSIIMPVYNAAPFLRSAVADVLGQTVRDFELLLIDDGSTDGSAELCRELAAADARVRAYHQPNAGICAARNCGLERMRGRWFTFCDDDDRLLPTALETLLTAVREQGTDAARTGYRLLRQNAAGKPVELPHPPGRARRLSADSTGNDYLAFLQDSGPQFVWNALYSTEKFGSLRFDPNCRNGLEDFVFNAAFYACRPTVAYLPDVTYEHLERRGSTSACADPAAVLARLQTVPRWVEGEYAAVCAWCSDRERGSVWASRCAEVIAFAMHQMRDSRMPPGQARAAWRMLYAVLAPYPYTVLDFWAVLRQNKKKAAVLLLFRTHLQGLYGFLPNREEKLLR